MDYENENVNVNIPADSPAQQPREPQRPASPGNGGFAGGNGLPYNPNNYAAPPYTPPQNQQQYGAPPYTPQRYYTQPYNPLPYNQQPYNQPYNQQYGAPQFNGGYPPAYNVPQTPQSVYGNNPYYAQNALNGKYVLALKEKREIRQLSVLAGGAMFGYLIISYALIFILGLFDSNNLYETSDLFSSGFNMLYSVLAVGLPFLLMYVVMKKRGAEPLTSFDKPRSDIGFIPIVLFGFAMCIAANYITLFIADIFESFGITLPYENSVPELNALSIIVLFVETAAIPALIEELAIRGILLQLLRKHGDVFAITASSAVFALMHANAVQIPFAFMAGLALGYIFCKTNTIWAGIAVHFLNNALSCVETLLYELMEENTAFITSTAISVSVLAVGIIILIWLARSGKLKGLRAPSPLLTQGQRVRAFCFQPSFIAAALMFCCFALLEI